MVAVQYRQGDGPHAVPQTPGGPLPLAPTPSRTLDAQLIPAPVTPAPAHVPAARAQLKIIGLGLRGISAVNRLIVSGSLPEAEFWALDSDKRVLSAAHAASRLLEVGPGDDASLGQAELAALAGAPTGPAAAEAPDGHAGAVFVLGSAFGSPGGAPMLLQLVRHLRRQGYFVAAALTRPFEFEGARRLEAADTLISTMQEVAHLVVVIAQGVLTRASTELTMGQAQAIADNTLVYTVQSTLWALRAPEVLKVSHGAFLWHGRDLRAFKRPLFPPMMNLLSCPGHATLGRGQAALPRPLLQQAGLASALSTLAEDAVKAAAESPFLDNKMESATGVLCVLRVPPSVLGVACSGPAARPVGAASPSGGGPLAADSHKEYALRSAVQVAAMTVRELVGPHCHDIIVCPQLSHDLEVEAGAEAGADAAQRGGAGEPQPTQGAAAAAAATQGPSNPDQAAGPTGREAGGAQAAAPTPSNATSVAQAGAAAAPQGGAARPTAPPPPPPSPIVRVEVSLLVLEAIEEAAEARPIARHKAPGERAASSAASLAGPAALTPSPAPPAAPAAATARDRIGAVIGSRGPSAPGRLATPGAPGAFTGQSQQYPATAAAAAGAAPSGAPGSTSPAWAGPPPPAGTAAVRAAGAAGVGAAPVGGAASGLAAGTGAGPATAGAGSAADSASARKQARLAAMSAMSALAGGTAAAAHGGLHGGGGGSAAVGGGAGARGATAARGYPQQQAQPQDAAGGGLGSKFGLQQIPRMAESLVTSLVAQSLDLPPQAARWRHQLRSPPPNTHDPTPSVFQLPSVDGDLNGNWIEEASDPQVEGLGHGLQQLIAGMRLPGLGGGADDGSGGPAAAGPAAVRNRVAGMLDRERQDAGTWDAAGTGV